MRSSVAGFENGATTNDSCIDEKNLRCPVWKCEGVTFKSRKELTRHARQHNPDSTLWYCGCCQNLGHSFEGKFRKDKVQTHLRNKHEISGPGAKKTIGIVCPTEGCHALFTAFLCVDRHLKQQHPNHTWDESNQSATGRHIILTRR